MFSLSPWAFLVRFELENCDGQSLTRGSRPVAEYSWDAKAGERVEKRSEAVIAFSVDAQRYWRGEEKGGKVVPFVRWASPRFAGGELIIGRLSKHEMKALHSWGVRKSWYQQCVHEASQQWIVSLNQTGSEESRKAMKTDMYKNDLILH
jgi:hypothetical protein